jgi:hypothetical protein
VIEAFSRRSTQIRAYLDEHPELGDGPRAAQVAALATRAAKESGVSTEPLVGEWRALAAEHGVDREALARLCGQDRVADVDEQAVGDALAAPEGITARRSSFGRRDAVQAWAERLRQGAPVPRSRRWPTGSCASARSCWPIALTGSRGRT